MNSIRYFLALLLVIGLPAMLLFWLLIHPFIHAWRRLGPGWTYSIVGTLLVLLTVGLFLLRTPLLAVDFGTRYPLLAVGIGCLAITAGLGRSLYNAHMTPHVLVGLPELGPGALSSRADHRSVRPAAASPLCPGSAGAAGLRPDRQLSRRLPGLCRLAAHHVSAGRAGGTGTAPALRRSV